jgi:hypothetical protein
MTVKKINNSRIIEETIPAVAALVRTRVAVSSKEAAGITVSSETTTHVLIMAAVAVIIIEEITDTVTEVAMPLFTKTMK